MAQNFSWFRKHRPRSFAEYTGDFIKAAVKRMSDPATRPQVILIHGGYGCGKTTASRIFAGFYLCEDLTPEGMPCGKCAGCKQVLELIEKGEDDATSESIQEINGSVMNRVDDIRRLINESMLTLPTFSKYKVFIIDECHRITPDAQNALLKILEDIPEHLVVIFATTEVEKILPTIRSRCTLTIEVRKPTVQGMVEILTKIAKKEGLTFGSKALKLIATKGGRVPRDCISLLEDVAITYDGHITIENVLARTGEVNTEVYARFIGAAHKGLLQILRFISEFNDGDLSYQKFISGLSRFVLDAVYVRMGMKLEDFDSAYLKTLKDLFSMYKADEFHVLLKLIDEASRRSVFDAGSTDLALSVLALNIGDITKVEAGVSGTVVKSQAELENSEGAKKYVERDTAQRLDEKAAKAPSTQLEEFLMSLGAVVYDKAEGSDEKDEN